MESAGFLDAVRERRGLTSDRKLAAYLKIDQPRISAVRNGRRRLDPDMCIAVAAALEVPPEYVLASVQAERAKRTEHRRLWERLASLARASVLSLGVVAIAAEEVARAGQWILR